MYSTRTLVAFTCSYKPKAKHNPKPSGIPSSSFKCYSNFRHPTTPPAIDRVIDFGKYKGKMLGSLPSTYLKWVSKNLRAGQFEEWARLADQVLEDPIYQDRLEWEFADGILSGDTYRNTSSETGDHSSVSRLLEISERFGWDNEDKVGWSRVKFDLLGTTQGGRIPRTAKNKFDSSPIEEDVTEQKFFLGRSEAGKRRERRERRRAKSKVELRTSKSGIETQGSSENPVERIESLNTSPVTKGNPAAEIGALRFPGREGLIKQVLSRGKHQL